MKNNAFVFTMPDGHKVNLLLVLAQIALMLPLLMVVILPCWAAGAFRQYAVRRGRRVYP